MEIVFTAFCSGEKFCYDDMIKQWRAWVGSFTTRKYWQRIQSLCSSLIDFQAEEILWIKMGRKFLLFGMWKNNVSWGAHSFLRLSDRLFKKYFKMEERKYLHITGSFFNSLRYAFLSLFQIIMDLVVCQIVNIEQHVAFSSGAKL